MQHFSLKPSPIIRHILSLWLKMTLKPKPEIVEPEIPKPQKTQILNPNPSL